MKRKNNDWLFAAIASAITASFALGALVGFLTAKGAT